MWFMPTYGRPHALKKLLESPGGLPPREKLILFLTASDPSLWEYASWPYEKEVVDASSLGDSLRAILPRYPNEPCYGYLNDDHYPLTPNWWERLEAAAGDMYIAHAYEPGGDFIALPGVPCFGGGLMRAMQTFVPAGINHNSADVIWSIIGKEFNLIRPCNDVVIQHDHPNKGTAPMDATYERGAYNPVFSAADPVAREAWLGSVEKTQMYERIRLFLLGKQARKPITPYLGKDPIWS